MASASLMWMGFSTVYFQEMDVFHAPDFGLKPSKHPTKCFCKPLATSDTSTHGGFSYHEGWWTSCFLLLLALVVWLINLSCCTLAWQYMDISPYPLRFVVLHQFDFLWVLFCSGCLRYYFPLNLICRVAKKTPFNYWLNCFCWLKDTSSKRFCFVLFIW